MDTRFPAPLRLTPLAALLTGAALLSGCGGGNGDAVNTLPSFVVQSSVKTTTYDGTADDLLTAGLGAGGIASATPPSYADPVNPTAAELRRAAIYNNYRAIVDTTAAGGYGTFYGPNVDAAGNPVSGEGKVAGTETLAYSDDGSGQQNVTLMVQVPDSFDPAKPCIITATSSGSRGVYGAISTGEWGLKRGCAVAYTDKGTGGAPHDLMNDTVPLIGGTRATAAAAGKSAHFNAGLTAGELSSFNATKPNRFAFKHAHSGRNPEKDWGLFTRQAVQFAFYVLNERYGPTLPDGRHIARIKPQNTIVIASSVSNGGGAAIAAAEGDTEGLIDGVAVGEPAIEMPANPGVSVQRGGTTIATSAKTLFDFTSYANLYQVCAALAPSQAGAPGVGFVVAAWAGNRCTALKNKGLLTGSTTGELAENALQKLRDYGWEADSSVLHASLAAFEVAPAVTVTFGNALARAKVNDSLCGFSFAPTTSGGAVTTLAAPTLLPQMFATGNGVPPSSGIQLVNDQSVGGPLRAMFSVSQSTGLQDMDLDGAECLRNLLTGTDATALKLQAGIDETRRSGNLHGKPAIIVHGRNDALLPVNHTSRPYLALNRKVEGNSSQLSYIEVANAQHFDSFIGLPAVLPGYDSRFVPLHVYLNRALDTMYEHLRNGGKLPASQVVRTVPRGGTPGAAPALTASNVPAIATTPAAADAITVSGNTVQVPD